MTQSIRGTRTEKNLLFSFANESQARNRYTYYASRAKKEGYEQIASIFEETANQEKEHAERFFKFLEGGTCLIEGDFPAGIIADTYSNLMEAAKGEHHEAEELYPEFARVAEQEGFSEIASVFRAVISAERFHEERYKALAENIQKNKVFHRDREVSWRCRNCGYVFEGTEAPQICPACAHAQAYFELTCRNW